MRALSTSTLASRDARAGLDSVRHWDGRAWSPIGAPFPTYGVWGPAPGDVWLTGNHFAKEAVGTTRHIRGGRTTQIDGLTHRRLRGVWGDGKSMWIVGDAGTILRRDL